MYWLKTATSLLPTLLFISNLIIARFQQNLFRVQADLQTFLKQPNTGATRCWEIVIMTSQAAARTRIASKLTSRMWRHTGVCAGKVSVATARVAKVKKLQLLFFYYKKKYLSWLWTKSVRSILKFTFTVLILTSSCFTY